MSKRFSFIFLIFIFVMHISTVSAAASTLTDKGSSDGRKTEVSQRPLIFAFPGYASRETITRRFTPFVEYLSRALKRKIVMKVLSNYFEVLEQLEKDSVDLAQLTPVLYTSVMDSDELEFLGIQVVKGDYFYQSHIVVPSDSKISELSQLRGKTIGFTNIFSSSGFIIPMLALKEKGLISSEGQQFFITRMLDDHDKLLYNLLKKRIDAAATYDDMVDDNSQSLKVICRIPQPIPEDAFVANLSTIDEKQLQSIREVFKNYWDKTGKSHIERFHGNDRIYHDFRKIVKP